jgi:predicted DNA binding protein
LLALAEQWSTASADDLPPLPTCRTAKQLSPDELKALVTAYKAGSTVYELAAQFGIHRATVGQRLRAQGVDTKPPGLYPEDIATAIALYQAGYSLASIAERFGTTASTVQRRLVEMGVVMRKPWERGA